MRAIIISDIHGNTKILEKILKENKNIDLKIFLGDFDVAEKEQKKLANIFDYSVSGNCDFKDISPISNLIDFEGIKIFILHGHTYGTFLKKIDFKVLLKDAKQKNASLVLHGHDHIADLEKKEGIIRFNPGSTSFPRDNKKPSYGIIEVENGKIIKLEHVFI